MKLLTTTIALTSLTLTHAAPILYAQTTMPLTTSNSTTTDFPTLPTLAIPTSTSTTPIPTSISISTATSTSTSTPVCAPGYPLYPECARHTIRSHPYPSVPNTKNQSCTGQLPHLKCTALPHFDAHKRELATERDIEPRHIPCQKGNPHHYAGCEPGHKDIGVIGLNGRPMASKPVVEGHVATHVPAVERGESGFVGGIVPAEAEKLGARESYSGPVRGAGLSGGDGYIFLRDGRDNTNGTNGTSGANAALEERRVPCQAAIRHHLPGCIHHHHLMSAAVLNGSRAISSVAHRNVSAGFVTVVRTIEVPTAAVTAAAELPYGLGPRRLLPAASRTLVGHYFES